MFKVILNAILKAILAILKIIIRQVIRLADYTWHNFYFYWQLGDKKAYYILAASLTVILTPTILLLQLIQESALKREMNCLALNVYYESRGETRAGQQAVAKVTLNRVVSSRYPDTICDVVYEKNWSKTNKRYVSAFSWTELDDVPEPRGASWPLAWKMAEIVYKQKHKNLLHGALFFHTKNILPYWASKKKPVAKIGQHIFYR